MKSLNLWLINIALSAFFMSCTDKSKAGLDLQPDESILGASLIDTFTVNISTVLEQENIYSSGSTVLLTGAYQDEYLGKVSSDVSFQLVPREENTLGTNPVCDSVFLTLSYLQNIFNDENGNENTNYHYYGDISGSVNLEVYQLAEAFESSTEKTYTTIDTLETKTTIEGTTGEFSQNPADNNILTIRLDENSYGSDVISNYSNTHATFLNNLMGLKVKPTTTSNGVIIGFNRSTDASFVTVHYHNDEGENKSITLVISDAARRYNHITADHTGTDLSALTEEGQIVPSDDTGNKMYLQASTGIRTLIEIPYLNDFFEENPYILINKAELILPIDPTTSINGFADAPPTNIALNEADDENLMIRSADGTLQYITNEGDQIGANRDENFYPYSSDNSNYRINLGLYLQTYTQTPTKEFKIIASPYLEGTSVNRAVLFNNKEVDFEKATFKVYYSKRGE